MFAPLVAQLKANPKTIVFTEGNDPRILQPYECNEHADPSRYGIPQVHGNAVKYDLPDIQKSNKDEYHPFDKHRRHRRLPGISHALYQRESKKCVQRHARCLCERQFGHKGEEQGGNCGSQSRGRKNCSFVHTGSSQDGWVHSQDITHCQECGYTCDNFRTDSHGLFIKP